jgi:hypothetical protein
MKTILELSPGDGFSIQMRGRVCIPPICGWSIQLVSSKEYLLSLGALSNQQLLLCGLESMISFQRVMGDIELRGPRPQKFRQPVLRWRKRWWRRLLLLHGGDCLHHGLHQLSFHCKNLMECLTIVKVLDLALLVVVISGLLTCIAAGVHHLMVARKRQ